MTIEIAAIPLALVAGVFGVLSPCVWPLVPVVTSSAATSGRAGPVYLSLGMAVSFALAGTLLSFLLVSAGLDPELFRWIAAGLLITVAIVLLVPRVNDWVSLRLSFLSSRFGRGKEGGSVSAPGQFGVGALLGIVWLPCVGPTLGAAIALASMGQSLPMAFVVMLAYGVGTAGILLVAGLASSSLLARWRPKAVLAGGLGKKILGWSLLILGLMVLTGFDKVLERFAVELVPSWIYTL
ncbi:MAG: cytochrome c biogenesis protein CcdA [Gemmatimonas sp.]|nr:cytochrome c biogenesis protein CcdA [Gemmatimonas sp.]